MSGDEDAGQCFIGVDLASGPDMTVRHLSDGTIVSVERHYSDGTSKRWIVRENEYDTGTPGPERPMTGMPK